jgi:predicted RNase H-like HicB family nuclease
MWIEITKEKTWYSAYIPDYRIHTQWENFEELIENLKEAVSLYFSKDKKEIPTSLLKLVNYKLAHKFNMVIS